VEAEWTLIMKAILFASVAAIFCLLAYFRGVDSGGAPRHFAPNGNFDAQAHYTPARAGFNLADASSPEQLNALPPGVLGLVWVGRCAGADESFKAQIEKFATNPKLFGFYLVDDPDPTGKWGPLCPGANLKAEADFIHAKAPKASTFISLMNMGTPQSPAFPADYAPASSHVDLFGIAPYPCRRGSPSCDLDMIGRFVQAAKDAGIPLANMVPTYQTFGEGRWRSADAAGEYRLPEPAEMQAMLQKWKALVGTPKMDFAYSWGRQREDDALESAPDLQQVVSQHNQ
jgi:hypothetical protein